MQGLYVKTQPGQRHPKYRISCHYNIFYVCERADDIEPTEPNTTTAGNLTEETYEAVLAKCYSTMAVSGQYGPDGASDISGLDGGTGQYTRALFMLNEFPTDETKWIWADEGVFDYIKSSKADILCLQEDLGDWLHPKVHLDSLYAHSVRIKVGSDSANALGVYSRFPIERHQQIHYESLRNGSLACWLDINGRKVIVINNHFESNRLTANDKTRYKNIIKGGD